MTADPFAGFDLKPGTFGVTRVPGWAGIGIRLGEYLVDGNADWSHAFVVVGSSASGDARIVEALSGGAQVSNLSSWGKRPVAFNDQQPLTPTQRRAIVAAALSYIGTPYGWMDYIALAAARVDLPSKALAARVESSRTLICSQLVDRAYMDAGVHLFADGRRSGDVTPGDLANYIETHAWTAINTG